MVGYPTEAHVHAAKSQLFHQLGLGKGIKRAVIFVPGYATSVAAAVRTAERLQRIFPKSDRIVIANWGSAGSHSAYRRDVARIRAVAPTLCTFLEDVHAMRPRIESDVFAHSLRARLVVEAINRASVTSPALFGRVALAAPDVRISDYAAMVTRKSTSFVHMTLYVSREDRALEVVSLLSLHPRLGSTVQGLRALSSTDTVDASFATSGVVKHGYGIHDARLVRDSALTLDGAPTPHTSWHRARTGKTWVYDPRN